MTESIEPNKLLEVTNNKGVIYLLIIIKCEVIVVDPVFPSINNNTHSAGLVF